MKKKVLSPEDGEIVISEKHNKKNLGFYSPKTQSYPKIFLGIAFTASILGALLATKTLSNINFNIAKAAEDARAANIQITKITTPNCADCFNVNAAVANLKKQNAAVGEEKAVNANSETGRLLINKFNIQRLPTYIATGEVTKKTIEGFIKSNGQVKNNTFIFTKVTPVYVDRASQKEMGRVTATVLTDPTCAQCIDLKLTVNAYKRAGIKITDITELAWNSAEGQALISRYAITKVPTFILSKDIDLYEPVRAVWTRMGTVEADKTYVARNISLPYRDLEKNQIAGLVDIIYLTDSTCAECYKPEITQKNILTRGYGVGLQSERTVDINSVEGQNLVSQYKITSVPTILLSASVDQYTALKNVWPNVGTVETDGWYVFRQMKLLGNVVYKDLTTNQIINPALKAASPTPTASSQ